MNTSQYCIPQNPTVSLGCNGCSDSDRRSGFSATVSASISGCRQGCNYSWSVSGINGSCSGGSISAGGSASPSCSISKTGIPNSTSVSGSVSLLVRNSHYTSRTDSASQGVSWQNTTPNLATCPATSFTIRVRGGSQITHVILSWTQGTEGDARGGEYGHGLIRNCGSVGMISHIESEGVARCTSAGSWELVSSSANCLRD